MPSPQKTKGKSYENEVAGFLTEAYGDRFMRVPTSGAYLGGANYDRRLTMTEGQIRSFKGDIIPPDNWNHFNCEAKFYKEFKWHLLYEGNKLFDSWLEEVEATADDGDVNLIFMKFNRIGQYMAYQAHEGYQVDSYTVYSSSWHITSHGNFWNKHNRDLIRLRCTGNQG